MRKKKFFNIKSLHIAFLTGSIAFAVGYGTPNIGIDDFVFADAGGEYQKNGNAVLEVQRTLIDCGYSARETGMYDRRTRDAVAEFQKDHFMVDSKEGELDILTIRALFGMVPEFPMTSPSVANTNVSPAIENIRTNPTFGANGEDEDDEDNNEREQNYSFSSSDVLESPLDGYQIEYENPSNKYTQKSANLIGTAVEFLGVPYVWGGETPKGFDCSGFVQYVYAKHGVNLPRTADIQATVGQKIERKEDLMPGDLVFFASDYKNISHVGIYVGDNKMIHASSGYHKIAFDDLTREYRVDHYMGARRIL